MMLATLSLVHRELLRFARQRSRVVGAFGTPVLFWFIIGSGVGKTFQSQVIPSDMDYLQYFFPGTLLLILLFTSIFSSISLIVDRKEGFLQGVLVAPLSKASIVTGKIGGGVILAVLQGVLFLGAAPFIGFELHVINTLLLVFSMVVVSLSLSTLGYYFAWKIDSIQGFHAVMNLLLFPMWLLSGALFPIKAAPVWLQWIMQINPLTYGLALMRRGLYGNFSGPFLGEPTFLLSVLVMLVTGAFFMFLSVRMMSRH